MQSIIFILALGSFVLAKNLFEDSTELARMIFVGALYGVAPALIVQSSRGTRTFARHLMSQMFLWTRKNIFVLSVGCSRAKVAPGTARQKDDSEDSSVKKSHCDCASLYV